MFHWLLLWLSIVCCFLFLQYAAHISSFLDGLCVSWKNWCIVVQGGNSRKFSRKIAYSHSYVSLFLSWSVSDIDCCVFVVLESRFCSLGKNISLVWMENGIRMNTRIARSMAGKIAGTFLTFVCMKAALISCFFFASLNSPPMGCCYAIYTCNLVTVMTAINTENSVLLLCCFCV